MNGAAHPGIQRLAGEVTELLRTRDRVMVGLAGPPGTGKSTVAAALVVELTRRGTSTALVPMDGFHLDQVELKRLGRADRKGAPDTFDVTGYVSLLQRLRQRREPVTYAPRFDRHLEQSIGSALPITADTRVILTEGNYLLLDPVDLHGHPSARDASALQWSQVRQQLDCCWYVEVDDTVRVQRLIDRHIAHGRSPEQAREWGFATTRPTPRSWNAAATEATAC